MKKEKTEAAGSEKPKTNAEKRLKRIEEHQKELKKKYKNDGLFNPVKVYMNCNIMENFGRALSAFSPNNFNYHSSCIIKQDGTKYVIIAHFFDSKREYELTLETKVREN